MAGLTKDDLKSALVDHGVEMNPSAAKKDELVALYEEFVVPLDTKAGEFSSDDETASPKKMSRRSKVSRASSKGKAAVVEKDNDAIIELTEENSLIVGDVNVNDLSDEDLIAYMMKYGIDVGPIVDSTRSLYQRKLAIVMREKGKEEDVVDIAEEQNGHQAINGSPDKAEFSADEEAIPSEDEEQPSVVVKESRRKSIPKTSPLQAIGSSLRQRFGGSGTAASNGKKENERFTPTPRRSIHTYKVSETTVQTMTKSKDGQLITHDVTYNKETSESAPEVQRSMTSVVLKVLPGIFMVLIIVALAYYVSSKKRV